jgi:hypothetical protein
MVKRRLREFCRNQGWHVLLDNWRSIYQRRRANKANRNERKGTHLLQGVEEVVTRVVITLGQTANLTVAKATRWDHDGIFNVVGGLNRGRGIRNRSGRNTSRIDHPGDQFIQRKIPDEVGIQLRAHNGVHQDTIGKGGLLKANGEGGRTDGGSVNEVFITLRKRCSRGVELYVDSTATVSKGGDRRSRRLQYE